MRPYAFMVLWLACMPMLTGPCLRAAEAAPAPPPKASALCREITSHIESDEKQLSYLTAQNNGEENAIVAASRNTQMTTLLATIRGNVSSLKAHGCPAYGHPISRDAYLNSAMKCQIADMQVQLSRISPDRSPLDEMRDTIDAAGGKHLSDGADGSGPCDRSKWTRD